MLEAIEVALRVLLYACFGVGGIVLIFGVMAGLEMVISKLEHWRDLVVDSRGRDYIVE